MCYPAKFTVDSFVGVSRKVHCVGINEAIITNLAIALQERAYEITGSVEAALESNVADTLTQNHILLPKPGFSADNISKHIDQVIIGREINDGNVEVRRARELGIPITTYAEYIREYAQDRQRIVITGDVDKTAALLVMVIYVLEYWHRSFDYVTTLLGLSSGIQLRDAPIILLQADVYASSAADPRPDFLVYEPHIAVISAIDPVYCKDDSALQIYLNKLIKLADGLPKAGSLIYNATMPALREIGAKPRIDVKSTPYHPSTIRINNKKTYLATSQGDFLISDCNQRILEAMGGAHSLLKELAITDMQFYEAISHFSESAVFTDRGSL